MGMVFDDSEEIGKNQNYDEETTNQRTDTGPTKSHHTSSYNSVEISDNENVSYTKKE
jgi:hypothetical protein